MGRFHLRDWPGLDVVYRTGESRSTCLNAERCTN